MTSSLGAAVDSRRKEEGRAMILVIGASGTNGREVVSRLAARGLPVRAMVRNPANAEALRLPGVEVVGGNLDDASSLDLALSGVDRAFYLSPVDQRTVRWFDGFLAAAKRSGTRHIVKFSGMGASPDSKSVLMRDHGVTDETLKASGLPFTILKPEAFFQNLLWSAASIRDLGAFYLPLGDSRQALVDVRDIASVAAEVLASDGHAGQVYDITGPVALSYKDVADTLSRVLDRPIRYISVTSDAALDSMLKSGMPEWNARAVAELYTVFADNWPVTISDAVQKVTGRPPTSFEQFARDHAAAFS
jgi:uncharacterized protein YbjT (DUF2867 family)